MLNIIGILKSFFSQFVSLYFIYLKLFNTKEYIRLINIDKSKILNISYPRTGNDYVKEIMRQSHSEVIVSHLHRCSNFDYFINTNPIFTIIRDPKECISSSILKYYSEKKLNKFPVYPIYDYYFFHKKLLKHSNKISFYLFEDLINRPKYFLKLIQKDLSLNDLKLDIDQDLIFKKLYNLELSTNKDIYMFKGPSEEKDKSKKEIINFLSSHFLYKRVLKLYSNLKTIYEKKNINF